jgi:hypothetical protein
MQATILISKRRISIVLARKGHGFVKKWGQGGSTHNVQ